MRKDAQLEQFGKDGRRLEAIALQFDHDEVVHHALHTRRQVVETEVGVDGQAFGLGLIDEGDTIEVILELFLKSLWGIMEMSADKVIVVVKTERGGGTCMRVEILCGSALLLRTPMVVLGLHLKEVQSHMEVGAHTDLLTHQMSCLMTIIHRTILCIIIEGIIRCDELTIDLLDVVLVASHGEQLTKHGHRGHELRVDAVHQTDISHLVEGDGLVLLQYFCHCFVFCTAKVGICATAAKIIQPTAVFVQRRVNSTGQWSEPKISVWMAASSRRSRRRSEMTK